MNALRTTCWFMFGKPWYEWRYPSGEQEKKFFAWYLKMWVKDKSGSRFIG